MKNRGDKAFLHDEEFLNSLTFEERKILEDLMVFKNNLSYMLENGDNLSSTCYCGSQRKYKNCHGKDFLKRINRL